MRADVARQIEQLVRGEISRRHAVQHLLIGRVRRLGRAAVLADQRRDRRAVDHIETVERPAAREARIDRRGVDDEQVFQQHAQPGGEVVAAVRTGEERERARYPRGGVGRASGIARANGVAEPGDLILAGFDHGAQQRQCVSERAQLEEGDAVVRTRDIGEIDPNG